MIQFGLFRMAQAIAGASTAGPMFFLGFQSFRNGNLEFGALMLVFGSVVFFLPGLLMERILDDVISMKDRVINGTKKKLRSVLPSIPFRDR